MNLDGGREVEVVPPLRDQAVVDLEDAVDRECAPAVVEAVPIETFEEHDRAVDCLAEDRELILVDRREEWPSTSRTPAWPRTVPIGMFVCSQYYFPTKDALITEVVMSMGLQLQETLGEAFSTPAADHLELARTGGHRSTR